MNLSDVGLKVRVLCCIFDEVVVMFTVVTLYATLGEEAVIHAIQETECSLVVTSLENLPKFQV